MPLENIGCRLAGYIARAVCQRESRTRDRREMIQQIHEMLLSMERGDPGLSKRLEDALSDETQFQGSDEQRLLTMTIDSVMSQKPRRALASREVTLEGLEISATRDPALTVEWEELKAVLEREIDGLPQDQKMLLSQIYVDGRKQSDLARELGVPKQTLNDSVRRIVASLARRIEEVTSFRV